MVAIKGPPRPPLPDGGKFAWFQIKKPAFFCKIRDKLIKPDKHVSSLSPHWLLKSYVLVLAHWYCRNRNHCAAGIEIQLPQSQMCVL